MKNNYELELPNNYEEVYHIDAKSKRIGVIFTIASLVILVVVMGICIIPLLLDKNVSFSFD